MMSQNISDLKKRAIYVKRKYTMLKKETGLIKKR